ncbi:MAG: UPF0489 family protein [bacterium]
MATSIISVQDKNIFIVENHHEVLLAWARYRRKLDKSAILITLDHHTDAYPGFTRHAYRTLKEKNIFSGDERENLKTKLISEILFDNDESVQNSIDNLSHDEHIDAAIRSKIVKAAFIINYDHPGDYPESIEVRRYRELNSPLNRMYLEDKPKYPERPFHYPVSEDHMYFIDPECHSSCRKDCHDDKCTRPHYDEALETVFLAKKLQIIFEMACTSGEFQSLIDENYILDIDLDYFHTEKSIIPYCPCMFYELIRKAGIITIAKESECVDELKLEGENVCSELLLEKCLEHIRNAMGK